MSMAAAKPSASAPPWLLITMPLRPRNTPPLDLRGSILSRKSNGGVFLGLNGIVIKSHGGADAEGFAAAIDMGYDMFRYELLAKIGESMARDLQSSATVPVASGAIS